MEVDECYRELGLAPGSTDAEVKAAWRRLAARWHPDRNDNPHALRKIQRINRALDGIRSSKFGGLEADEDDAPDPRPVAEHTISLTLEEVVTGCIRELRGTVADDCADCEGTGLQSKAAACSDCDGSGQVRQQLWFGWMSSVVKCDACQGHGTTRRGCTICAGSGKTPPRKYRCRAEIAPGARTGDVLDVPAHLEGRRGGPELVLRLRLQLQPHALFAAEADGTVKCELPVDGFAWVANRWIDVPTPRGLRQMRLKRGALAYRIKGAGLPWQDTGAAGDCIVTVVPMFPQELSPAQEAAIDRLVATNSGAAGTTAGIQVDAWNRQVESWAAAQGGRRK